MSLMYKDSLLFDIPSNLIEVEKFQYIFDPKTNIMFKPYYGAISVFDIQNSWDFAISHNLIPKHTGGFILDYRSAIFDIDIDEYEKIANYYKRNLDVFRNKKIAILINDSKDSVIPFLVQTKDDGYRSQPFSTVEGAMDWILYSRLAY